ncbi:FlgD immunoglobulin-like domain containing protein [Actinoplanes sp. CA-252034]|uniref:FlgD immunoglobulin-like domain containing protein n=1 Tax=Actinoplanes sp. CA-252034 TaxID=3239906 RepID=UPI003D9536A5
MRTIDRYLRVRVAVAMVAAAGMGGALGISPVLPVPPAFAAAGDAQLVIPASARAVPRATQIFTAGTTGFLWLQEGDDRLLWTDYSTGRTTALEQRLRSPLGYDINTGYFRNIDSDFEIGGTGSDTVALYYASPSPKVTLLTAGAGPVGEVPIPDGHSYRGTYGGVVVTANDGATPAAYHLWRSTNGGVTGTPVTGLPADATSITVEDGDGTSLILRYETGDGPHWSLAGLANGVAVALPDRLPSGESWEVSGFKLAPDSVLRLRMGRGAIDVYARDGLGAEPRAVEAGAFAYDSSYAVVGTHLLAMDRMAIGNSRFRGEPVWAVPTTVDDPDMFQVLAIGAHGLVQAPDGSVLVAGAEEDVWHGDTDLGIYRVRQTADGSVVRERLTDVQPMPAQVHGLSLGSGVLTTVADSTAYAPATIIGAYRSTWLTTPAPGSAPSVVRSTVDGYASGRDGFCSADSDRVRCIRMFADGTGLHGREDATEQGLTMLMTNGSTVWGPSVETGTSSPYLADLSGRYGVVNSRVGPGQHIVRFPATGAGSVLQQRNGTGSAVWGSTLWNASTEDGTIQAVSLPSGTAGESFQTANGCIPSKLQAVGRWVYWTCVDYWGDHHGSGVYDRVVRKAVAAPAGQVMLGDGFLVAYVAGAGLQLTDLVAGTPARTLVTEAALGAHHEAGTSWTVDRFGGGVAYADDAQRVHVVPTGIVASPLTVIDSEVSTAAASWAGTWWLSKPAASWQVTIRDRAGATLRTLSGSAATGQIRATWDGKDSAGKPVADGTFTWGLTAQPADGQGAALTVGDPAPAAVLRATKAPSVSGTVRVGSTVRVAAGTWSPAATGYAYQWYANGAAIKGATGTAYQITAGVLGKRLTVRVTASRAGHPSGSSSSASSAVVARGPAAKATARPKVTGKAKVGRTVRAAAGSWSPKADSYRYEWRLNGKLIKGATAATLKLKSSMRGKKLTVTVIARKAGHLDGRATSVTVSVRA